MNRCKQFQAASERSLDAIGEGRRGGGAGRAVGEGRSGEGKLEALRQQQGNFHNSRRFRWRRLAP